MKKRDASKYLTLLGIMILLTTSLWVLIWPESVDARQEEDSSAPVTDLVTDSIEITQSMQDLNNSVILVAGKRTFVRLYVHSTDGYHSTTATLKVETGFKTQTLLPIAPGGPFIKVRPAYNRLIPSHTFLFELPLWATFTTDLKLTATVNPDLRWHPRNPEEFSYSNNTIVKNVGFSALPTLHLLIANQPYKFNNQTYQARPVDLWKSVDWLKRAYPLSNVKAYFRILPALQATRKLDDNNNWVITFPNCSWLNLYLAYNRFAIFGSPFIPSTATFTALVADDIGFMRGCAPLNGMLTFKGYARAASGPAGAGNWGWDFDGSYADWYTGHEVGHAWGRPHVRGGPGYVEGGCGGELDSYKHYPDGAISPTKDIFSANAIFGFNSLNLDQGINPILGPNWSDVMTYCDYQWMSKITYIKLKEAFQSYLPLTSEDTGYLPGVSTTTYPLLSIFGMLDPQTLEVEMLPVSVIQSESEVGEPASGPFAIVLRGSGGQELARYPFEPEGLVEDQLLEGGAIPGDGFEVESAYISELIPFMDGIYHLEIEGPNGQVIFQVEAGLNLPAVLVTAPNGGESFGNESITVSWIASDEDGDPLTFNVDYSTDNGNSWEPVALFVTGTQTTIETINLPASDQGLFRVTASDGIHSAIDQSDGFFFIANHLPTGEIIAPSFDMTIAADQTITFEGQVYDIDLGMPDEGYIEWWSDRDGFLGYGATFNTASLSQGLHEITLRVDDGNGQHTLDEVIVTVVSSPNDLPPQPDALLAGPDLVFLYPTNGINSAAIYLDNLNLENNLAWNVSSDMDWVELSATSGLSPQDITVSTSLAGQDFGTHKALLTFFDPAGQYQPVYIVVVVTIPKYDLFLPMVVR